MLLIYLTCFANMLSYYLHPITATWIIPSYGGFAEGVHLFPYRTEKLSPSWPMVLAPQCGRVGSCHIYLTKASQKCGAFVIL